ncbi:hypothetical protein [Mycolicibacterium fortuitum]|uniref:hypothetical protein n=1 Tax=Mycolicibacterium fortuitum TaxID=1766 RepID=UPI001CDD8777|nr:hypothetical protein [Mycolicibacterium fortuitum]
MGAKRPWKVYFHHDGTKTFSDDESMDGAYTIDTSRPIDGVSSHAHEEVADSAARRVSRNGGAARIVFRDPTTGEERPVRTYAPYEDAMNDLTSRG